MLHVKRGSCLPVSSADRHSGCFLIGSCFQQPAWLGRRGWCRCRRRSQQPQSLQEVVIPIDEACEEARGTNKSMRACTTSAHHVCCLNLSSDLSSCACRTRSRAREHLSCRHQGAPTSPHLRQPRCHTAHCQPRAPRSRLAVAVAPRWSGTSMPGPPACCKLLQCTAAVPQHPQAAADRRQRLQPHWSPCIACLQARRSPLQLEGHGQHASSSRWREAEAAAAAQNGGLRAIYGSHGGMEPAGRRER